MPAVNTKKSKNNAAPATDILVPSITEASFQAVRPRFAAIPLDSLIQVNIDLQVASVFALGVGRIVTEPDVRARFTKLARTGEYDDACVDDLTEIAQAAWYVRHRFLLTSAIQSAARISADLLDEATTQRARMLTMADYWLGDDIALSTELAAIRAGAGYQDLANDLIALASLFDRNTKALTQDRKLYRASDATTANRLAGAILQQLGASATQEQSEWSGMQHRAWTLLLTTYEEVRRGGLFLFAKDRADERFPSLLAVCRSPPSRSAKEKEADVSSAPVDSEAPAP
jgi:hypothetical protein